jgi:hypothetical protein
MGRKRNAYRVLVGEQERKKTLGRPRLRCENYIKTDLKEIGSGDVDWINMTLVTDHRPALVNTVMNLRISRSVGKFLSKIEQLMVSQEEISSMELVNRNTKVVRDKEAINKDFSWPLPLLITPLPLVSTVKYCPRNEKLDKLLDPSLC